MDRLAVAHGAFYLGSGLWPVVDLKSFERVTGPKADDWLVKTVGLLLASTGLTLLRSGLRHRKRVPPEVRWLAGSQAAVLGGVSATYGLRGRISRIYLLDFAVEALIAGAWAARSRR